MAIDPKTNTALIRLARESGEDVQAEPLALGWRVRELRKDKDWTLEQAARKADQGGVVFGIDGHGARL